MADYFPSINANHRSFIDNQQIFFVASADSDGRINLSPKGQTSLVITGENELIWLNLTGSGNETAAHIARSNRMTLMWCSFMGPPQILRMYGSAEIVHPRDKAWEECAQLIEPQLGARQFFRMQVDSLYTSCGYGVPQMDFVQERTALEKWTEKKGSEGVAEYWRERNQTSLDGHPTEILKTGN